MFFVPKRNDHLPLGGGRSALAAESLQKMAYKNVRSMDGGFKACKAGGLPTT